MPPHIFSLGFVFGEISDIKVTFVWKAFHFICYTYPSWCWNRVWCDITDSDIFINLASIKCFLGFWKFF